MSCFDIRLIVWNEYFLFIFFLYAKGIDGSTRTANQYWVHDKGIASHYFNQEKTSGKSKQGQL